MSPASRCRRGPAGTGALLLLAAVAATGCAGIVGSGAGADPEARFRSAASAAEEERYGAAARQLRRLAERCESGAWGPDAVLLLAALEIDPRNPRPSPAAAAQLTARYLQVPGLTPTSVAVGEALHLLALDLGARPVDDPFSPVPVFEEGDDGRVGVDSAAEVDSGGEPAGAPSAEAPPESDTATSQGSSVRFWRVADRFVDCGDGGRRSREAALPEHPGMPLWWALESAFSERDSLAAEARDAARLRIRVDSLEAELERIRSLLERSPGPPPSGDGR